MNSKSGIKLRMCGHRMKWTFIRLVIFITTLAIFSADPYTSYILFTLVAGCILFFSKDRLRTDRENQLTRELVDAHPTASAEQLRGEYQALFRLEIRRDALLYLFFAVYAALWLLVLRGQKVSGLSVDTGLLVVVPALLITALVLLIRSLLPRTGTAPVPALEDYIKNRTNQQERSERLARPDLRRQGRVICTEEKDEAPPLALICAALQPYVRDTGISVLLILGRILVLVTVLGWLIMGLAMGGGYMAAALAFLSYYILAKVFVKTLKKEGSGIAPAMIPVRIFRRLNKSGVLVRDRAISIIPSIQSANTLEICFDKTGTLLCHCSVQDYRNFLDYRDREAYLLRDNNRFYGLCFLKEDSAA